MEFKINVVVCLLKREDHTVDEYLLGINVPEFSTEESEKSVEKARNEASSAGYSYVKTSKIWHMLSPKIYDDISQEEWHKMVGYRTEFGKHHSTTDTGLLIDECPNGFVYICHKCGGLLKGAEFQDKIAGCRCISGWIRPWQGPVEFSKLTIGNDKRVTR